MSARTVLATMALAALAGCGLEGVFGNATHDSYDRPASRVVGAVSWPAAPSATFVAFDPGGAEILPFQSNLRGGAYEVRLPSSRYSMIRVQGRAGGLVLRTLVPSIGEESTVSGANLDARDMTETLIVEAWLSANGKSFSLLTPAAYVGNGVDTGTRTLIRQRIEQAGPTRELFQMVERLIASADVLSGQIDPDLFLVPVLAPDYDVVETPVGGGLLARGNIDYTGDGIRDGDSAAFDAKLAEVVQLYQPEGCPDPDNVRVVFSVDFVEGSKDGNGGNVNRFKWATDKPGKQMFFVAWVHVESPIQDPDLHNLVGAGVPNQLAMFDDGTNGDEVSGDGIWSIYFDVPRGVRLGYKYTWGLRGQGWTGSEEWPGNSRIIQVDDLSGDDFVYRRDVFADEATNKDRMNLNIRGTGTVTWDTDVRGCGRPEPREQPFVLHTARDCGDQFFTPQAIGPLTVACPGG